jgi:hypothetical protein
MLKRRDERLLYRPEMAEAIDIYRAAAKCCESVLDRGGSERAGWHAIQAHKREGLTFQV